MDWSPLCLLVGAILNSLFICVFTSPVITACLIFVNSLKTTIFTVEFINCDHIYLYSGSFMFFRIGFETDWNWILLKLFKYLTFKCDGYSGSVNTCREVKRNNDQTIVSPSELTCPLGNHLLTKLSCIGTLVSVAAQTRQYFFVSTELIWTEAQRVCKNNFTDLATIENLADVGAVINTTAYNGEFLNSFINICQAHASTQPFKVQAEDVFQF